MNAYEFSQNVWQQVQQLGALVATPGVDDATKEKANELIRTLLDAVKPQISKMSASASGILIK